MAKKKSKSLGGSGVTIKSAISRPGALTKRKKKGESTAKAASRIMKSSNATPLAKQQASFYKNVLAPANRKRKKKK